MQLVLDTKGLRLEKKRNSFLISVGEEARSISPKKVSSIAITAEVLISSSAVRLAIQNQIPILFFDRIGKAEARLWSPYFESLATLRRQQIKFAESTAATDWIIKVFALKTAHQIENLEWLGRELPKERETLKKTIAQMRFQEKAFSKHENQLVSEVRGSLMGIEGTIARVYFQTLGQVLPPTYQFERRSRRPARDAFNAALNYLYGMFYSVVESGLFAAGLDPHLGILHADAYHKPTLAFDLIEAFRPWVDRVLLELCLSEELLSSFFTRNQHGLFLNKKGKALLIPHFNGWLQERRKFQFRELTTRNHIYQTAGQLAVRLRGFSPLISEPKN